MSQIQKIKGSVVLMKMDLLDSKYMDASVVKCVYEFLRQSISIQLISVNGSDGKPGKEAYMENLSVDNIKGETKFDVTFELEGDIGIPGAFLIKNKHHSEFFLKDVTLKDVPGAGEIHFNCNSWVCPAHKCKKDRIFFSNKTYLPSDTPSSLRKYREQELDELRGNGTGELQKWDRVYDYDYYNDLGDPDMGHSRPVLGGSTEYPYPRRGRTGRQPTLTKKNCESRPPLLDAITQLKLEEFYVPRDEKFGHTKMSDFIAYALKSLSQVVKSVPLLLQKPEFVSFEHLLKVFYEGGLVLPPELVHLGMVASKIPIPFQLAELIKEILRSDGEKFPAYPLPQVIKDDKTAWRTDEEFAREMLAGVNPVSIRRLEEFPPASKLDPKVYGDHRSTIKEEHIKNNMDGVKIEQALKDNRLFILDHHDALVPYLRRINSIEGINIYGSRTILFLKSDGTLKPLAIELSLPHPDGDKSGCISKVYTPAEQGVEGSIWQLAKAYAAVNDSGYHQLISHWLNTHCVIEPFIIATHRQLSVLHPIHKLLHPHFHDTMNINALARQILINAGGILEMTVFPGMYAMELSAEVYKSWVFPDQALPTELINRGMAVKDAGSPHGVRLVIEDYPYAVDGLNIWSALKTWVTDYCSFYYKTDDMVQNDSELRSWWKELVETGHGDKRNESWWPKLQTRDELIETCTIIIWTASALHAAVNFGQYPYAGYLPNRPTKSRRVMPKIGTPEYEELKTNPDLVFLKTITSQYQTLIGVSLIEILSRHSSDEVYLGKRDNLDVWTSDTEVVEAFKRFGKKLAEIEAGIVRMNNDEKLKNRVGPVKVPYTLLYPSGEVGLSGKGIPNSVSI